MPEQRLEQASMDAVEAVADALLTSAAVALLSVGMEPTVAECFKLTQQALKTVIERSVIEGPKPR